MKVRLSHLLIALLLIIIFSGLGLNIKEGMSQSSSRTASKDAKIYML